MVMEGKMSVEISNRMGGLKWQCIVHCPQPLCVQKTDRLVIDRND